MDISPKRFPRTGNNINIQLVFTSKVSRKLISWYAERGEGGQEREGGSRGHAHVRVCLDLSIVRPGSGHHLQHISLKVHGH